MPRYFQFAGWVIAALTLASCASAPGPRDQMTSFFRLDTSDGLEERIVTDVRINGRPAQLTLDTGLALPFALFPAHIAPLGLKIDVAPAPDPNPLPGMATFGTTSPTKMVIFGQTLPGLIFRFAELPPEISPTDGSAGMIGWPAIDESTVAFIFSTEPPMIDIFERIDHGDEGWSTFTVPEGETLSLKFAGEPRGLPRLIIDTGNDAGVLLPPARWQEWKAANPDAPMTIMASYMFGQKLAAKEVAWADEIRVGDLVFRGVPVEEADAAYARKAAEGEEIVALGVAALKRLDLIVEGKARLAYAHALESPPTPYRHNRAGVAFLPSADSGDNLVARVIVGGPAFRAGVREGDLLLKVNQQDYAGWRQDPRKLRKLFNPRDPAGTKWELTVQRPDGPQTITVVAEDLLGPGLKRQK